MIYLFYGSDVEKARAKAFDWVAAARKKEPELLYIRLAKEELTDAALEEVAASGGLFVKRLLILLDDPFAKARSEDEESEEGASSSLVEEKLDLLADSDNAIVILAPKLLASKAKRILTKAKMSYKFDAPAREDARGFNSALVNALALRDGEKLWLELERSLLAGDAPEQLHGLLHWKARDLLEKGSRAWSPADSRKLSLDLITLLMQTRRKGLDLAASLERFALSVGP